jgi:hypothetical protein
MSVLDMSCVVAAGRIQSEIIFIEAYVAYSCAARQNCRKPHAAVHPPSPPATPNSALLLQLLAQGSRWKQLLHPGQQQERVEHLAAC